MPIKTFDNGVLMKKKINFLIPILMRSGWLHGHSTEIFSKLEGILNISSHSRHFFSFSLEVVISSYSHALLVFRVSFFNFNLSSPNCGQKQKINLTLPVPIPDEEKKLS